MVAVFSKRNRKHVFFYRVIETPVTVWENSKKLWKHLSAACVPTAFLVVRRNTMRVTTVTKETSEISFVPKKCNHDGNHKRHSVLHSKLESIVLFKKYVSEVFSNSYMYRKSYERECIS